MLTTVLVAGLILWDRTDRAHIHERWYAWGDHGPYSPISYGEV